jgi:uncharacterized protein (TIGR02145 family)
MHGYNYDGTTDTTNNKIAKALAAQTDWQAYTGTGNPGGDLTNNNSSWFSALPGGFRNSYGSFYNVGDYGLWWGSTESSASSAYYRDLYYDYGYLGRYDDSKSCGFSVRLVRD